MFEQILSSLDGLTDLERADVLRVLMSKDNRLSKVKALLGITTTDQDDVLEFVIQTVEDMILSYINQDTLPPRLENVLIVMCCLLYTSSSAKKYVNSRRPLNTRSCLKLNPITGTEATSSERRLTLRTVQTRRSNTRS